MHCDSAPNNCDFLISLSLLLAFAVCIPLCSVSISEWEDGTKRERSDKLMRSASWICIKCDGVSRAFRREDQNQVKTYHNLTHTLFLGLIATQLMFELAKLHQAAGRGDVVGTYTAMYFQKVAIEAAACKDNNHHYQGSMTKANLVL